MYIFLSTTNVILNGLREVFLILVVELIVLLGYQGYRLTGFLYTRTKKILALRPIHQKFALRKFLRLF